MAFGRQVNGMGDFTPCFLNPRVKSRAFQLACAVVFFNPLQYIHWYDAPLDSNQTQYPELKFWSDMPTVWDDTKVLSGEPGEYIAIARRKGTIWFVSVITDKPREISIPLSFITDRKPTDKLDLTLYKENPQNTLECKVEHRTACTTDSIPAVMGQEGGFNMVIR